MRGTGKTTRMLNDAICAAKQGRAVYVLAANKSHANILESRCSELEPKYKELGIKFETPESLGHFDWAYMRLPGAHPRCLFLADHFAIEHHFSQMLEMLHRYDEVRQ